MSLRKYLSLTFASFFFLSYIFIAPRTIIAAPTYHTTSDDTDISISIYPPTWSAEDIARYEGGEDISFVESEVEENNHQVLEQELEEELEHTHNTPHERENAAIVILVRNREAPELARTLREFEQQFNSRYHYPYVMLNDVPFTEEFKETVEPVISGSVEYGLIDVSEWSFPSWIDVDLAKSNMARMQSEGVIYGGSESYRHMCRYNSGFFFRHPLVMKYHFYWRVEPGVRFLCRINYDVFKFMRENNKKYSFVITFDDVPQTVPTLYSTVKEYAAENNITSSWMGFFEKSNGEYNLCHFWSNFEIGDLRFFRSKQYIDFFNYLDHAGGFFYERWGDAPVHSLATGLFLKKSEVHFFKDIGYFHPPYGYCPAGTHFADENCYECANHNFLSNQHNCLPEWLSYEPDESNIPDFIPR